MYPSYAPLMMLASAADYRLTLYEKSVVGGTELAPGEYRVHWHVVSDDMHKVQGDFTFEVKQ